MRMIEHGGKNPKEIIEKEAPCRAGLGEKA